MSLKQTIFLIEDGVSDENEHFCFRMNAIHFPVSQILNLKIQLFEEKINQGLKVRCEKQTVRQFNIYAGVRLPTKNHTGVVLR